MLIIPENYGIVKPANRRVFTNMDHIILYCNQ